MSIRGYTNYKAGGDWLDEVPEHWTVCPLRRVTETITDGAHVSPDSDGGVYPFVSTTDIAGENIDFENCLRTSEPSYQNMVKTGCRPLAGDVLFSKDGTIGRTAVVKHDRDFAVASSLIIIRPAKGALLSGFLNRLCQSTSTLCQVECLVKGAGLPRLSLQNLRRVVAAIPPLDEQDAIATFLDRETAKIDALVAEQQKLIELLGEERRAAASRAVTRGLQPDAQMRDSRSGALGSVPAHWRLGALRRFLTRIEQGWSPQCDDRLARESEWGVLKAGCVNHGRFSEMEHKVLPSELAPDFALEVRRGDLLVCRASGSSQFVGAAAVVPECRPRLLLSDKVFRLQLEEGTLPEFIAMALGSSPLRQQIDACISGADGLANNLPQAALKSLVVAVPPTQEQEAIVRHVSELTRRADSIEDDARAAIRLLRARRIALISAAVTGQIDVRTIVAA